MNLLSANETLLCWESKNDASFIKLIQKLYSDSVGEFCKPSWISELRSLTWVMGGNGENRTSCQKHPILCLIEMNVYLEQHLSQFPNLCTRENGAWKFWVCLMKAFCNFFCSVKKLLPFSDYSCSTWVGCSYCCRIWSTDIDPSTVWSSFKFPWVWQNTQHKIQANLIPSATSLWALLPDLGI